MFFMWPRFFASVDCTASVPLYVHRRLYVWLKIERIYLLVLYSEIALFGMK